MLILIIVFVAFSISGSLVLGANLMAQRSRR